jgi:hypothetical protein
LSEITRKKSQPLTGFNCRPYENDSADAIRGKRFDRAGDRKVSLTSTRGTDAESQIPFSDVRKIVSLVSASRADTAAWHTYRVFMLLRVADDLPGLTLLQRQVDTLGSHFLISRQVKQLSQSILGAFRKRADDAKIVAAPADLHIQARFEQPQILIQRATQIREPRVVGGLEIEFSLGFGPPPFPLTIGRWGNDWSFQDSSLPRSVCARSSVITTSTK